MICDPYHVLPMLLVLLVLLILLMLLMLLMLPMLPVLPELYMYISNFVARVYHRHICYSKSLLCCFPPQRSSHL